MYVLELTYSTMRSRLFAYIKENFGVIAVILFVFVAGVAAGIRIMQTMYHAEAREILTALPSTLRAEGIPWLHCLFLSLFVQVLTISLLLLSGLWLPTAPFWVVGILLRGMLIGTAIGACAAAWPSHTAICLLLLLQLEAALLLPPLLRLGVLSQQQIACACKIKLRLTQQVPAPQDYTAAFLRTSIGLVPCVLLQGFLMPAVLSLFC